MRCKACGAPLLSGANIAVAIRALGDELATAFSTHPSPPLRVAVEGHARDLRPIVRDEIYKVAAEALRNAYRHAEAGRSKPRSATTTRHSACGSVTMARASMRPC